MRRSSNAARLFRRFGYKDPHYLNRVTNFRGGIRL